MATNYIKKVNGLAIAASEVAPNSPLASTLNTMLTGAFEVVSLGNDDKPDVSSPSTKVIYLTKASTSTATDPYTEWIYTSSSTWEIIGETSVDLSQYVNNLTTSGSGSYVTNVTKSGKTITVTKGNLPTASTSVAGIVQLGTAAGTAAQGNHTHTTTLATDSGDASVTLAHNTTYKLTAGGTSVIFKTPTDNNSDTKVTQTKLDGTQTGAYPIILKNSTTATDSPTSTVNYVAGITVTPSTSTITATNFAGNATTATSATNATNATNYTTNSGNYNIETALSGKSATSHTHSVKINGSTKTIAASGGTAVDLGNYLTGVTVNGTTCTVSSHVAEVPLAAVTSTSGAGAAGAVTLEIVSI